MLVGSSVKIRSGVRKKKEDTTKRPISVKRKALRKRLAEYEESARFLMEIDPDIFWKMLPFYYDSRRE